MRMDVKEYLSQVKVLDLAIGSKQEQILQMRKYSPQSTGVVELSGGTHSSLSTVERIVEKIAEQEMKLNALIDEYVDKKAEIVDFIAQIEDMTMRTVLEYHYICGDSWEVVADKMYISTRNVHYIHKRAIGILSEKLGKAV